MNANEYLTKHGSTIAIALSHSVQGDAFVYFPLLCTLEQGEGDEVRLVAVQELRQYARRSVEAASRIATERFRDFAVVERYPDFGFLRPDNPRICAALARYEQRLQALLASGAPTEAYVEARETRYGLADARQVLLSPGVWQYAPYAGGVGGWIISRTPRPGAYRAECLGVHRRGNALVCEAIRLVERVA